MGGGIPASSGISAGELGQVGSIVGGAGGFGGIGGDTGAFGSLGAVNGIQGMTSGSDALGAFSPSASIDGVHPSFSGFGGGVGGAAGDFSGGNFGGGDFGSGGGFGNSGGGGGGLLGGQGAGIGSGGLLNSGLLQFLLGFLMGGMMSPQSKGADTGEKSLGERTSDAQQNIAQPQSIAEASGELATGRVDSGQMDKIFEGVSPGEAKANMQKDGDDFVNDKILVQRCIDPTIIDKDRNGGSDEKVCCVRPEDMLLDYGYLKTWKPWTFQYLVDYWYPTTLYEVGKPYHSRIIPKEYVKEERKNVAQMKSSQGDNRAARAIGSILGGGDSGGNSNYASEFEDLLKGTEERAIGAGADGGGFYRGAHAVPDTYLNSKEIKKKIATEVFSGANFIDSQFYKVPEREPKPVGFEFTSGYKYVINPDSISELSNSKSPTNPAEAWNIYKNDPLCGHKASANDRTPEELSAVIGSGCKNEKYFPGKNFPGFVPFGFSQAPDDRTMQSMQQAWQIGMVAALVPSGRGQFSPYERMPYAMKQGQKPSGSMGEGKVGIVSDKIFPQLNRFQVRQCLKGPDEPLMRMEQQSGGKAMIINRDDLGVEEYRNLTFTRSCPAGYVIHRGAGARCQDMIEFHSAFREPLQ